MNTWIKRELLPFLGLGLVACFAAGALMIASGVGGLSHPDTIRPVRCDHNLVKIDGAVQQLIIDENYLDQAEAIRFLKEHGGISYLVEEKDYLRTLPQCPEGGSYELVEASDVSSVKCSIEGHTYPNETQSMAASGSASQ